MSHHELSTAVRDLAAARLVRIAKRFKKTQGKNDQKQMDAYPAFNYNPMPSGHSEKGQFAKHFWDHPFLFEFFR